MYPELFPARKKQSLITLVYELHALQYHYDSYKISFNYWHELENNLPHGVLLWIADFADPPKIGGGGPVEFGETPHLLRTMTTFGVVFGARSENTPRVH